MGGSSLAASSAVETRNEGLSHSTIDAESLNPFQAPSESAGATEFFSFGSGIFWLLFSFDGRISRRTFWAVYIPLYIYAFLSQFVLLLLSDGGRNVLIGAMPVINALLVLCIMLAVYAKRWHDLGKSGWCSLLMLIPCVGPLLMLVQLGFIRGNRCQNAYGPDPLADR